MYLANIWHSPHHYTLITAGGEGFLVWVELCVLFVDIFVVAHRHVSPLLLYLAISSYDSVLWISAGHFSRYWSTALRRRAAFSSTCLPKCGLLKQK